MHFRHWSLGLALAVVLAAGAPAQQTSAGEWKSAEDAMGRPGQPQPGEVFKFAMPRKDLHVMVQGIAIQPALALGAWAAFKHVDKNQTMVMGDLVLTEGELGPVMQKLQEGGIEVSAVHNHLVGESPRVMYMHISSYGDAVKMARAIRAAVVLTKTPAPDATVPSTSEARGLDQKKIEGILGRAGKVNGGVLQFAVPRAEIITDHSTIVPPAMGVATALNFQPTGEGRAAITGDFVLLGKEVNPVLKALRENGIQVTGVHSHMLMEEPRLFFMHFWAHDDAVKLAKGLRAALDQTNSKKD